jgi:hypothetical protein
VDTLEAFARLAAAAATITAGILAILRDRRLRRAAQRIRQAPTAQERIRMLELTVEVRDATIEQLANALAACRDRAPQQ